VIVWRPCMPLSPTLGVGCLSDVRWHILIKRQRFILPWAALGGVGVAVTVLLVDQLGIWTNERILLWPTYQFLRLDRWNGGRWSIALSFLLIHALVWTLMLATCGVLARWVVSTRGKQGAA
jgi:hypothetical protein